MIILENNIGRFMCVRIPCEADVPLVIDPYAVSRSIEPSQQLQEVAWWRPQVIDGKGGIQRDQLQVDPFRQVGWDLLDELLMECFLCTLVSE